MLFYTHIAISLFVALFLSQYFAHKVGFILLVLVGTTLADIDSEKSWISKNFALFSKIIRFFAKHRGFFHSFTAAIILALLISSISRWAGLAVFAGYSLHLLADSLTRQGICIFWPFSFKIRGRIRTGGIAERVIFLILTILIVIYIIRNFI